MISIGYVIGTIVAVVIALAAVGCIIFGRALIRRVRGVTDYNPSADDTRLGGRFLFWGGIGTLLVTPAIYTAAAFPPFDMQYHTYKPVSGTVSIVDTRMMADGHGSTQYYVVKFAGDPAAYRCDDSRCSLLKPGSTAHLKCIREWQYAAVPGWDCNYDQEG